MRARNLRNDREAATSVLRMHPSHLYVCPLLFVRACFLVPCLHASLCQSSGPGNLGPVNFRMLRSHLHKKRSEPRGSASTPIPLRTRLQLSRS